MIEKTVSIDLLELPSEILEKYSIARYLGLIEVQTPIGHVVEAAQSITMSRNVMVGIYPHGLICKLSESDSQRLENIIASETVVTMYQTLVLAGGLTQENIEKYFWK